MVVDEARRAITDATADAIVASGMSAYELARRIGVAESSLSRYLAGLRVPTDETVALIEDGIGLVPGTIEREAIRRLQYTLATAS